MPRPPNLPLGLHLHVAELLGVHVAAMRIEPAQHAVQRILHQFLVGDRLDIIGADPLEHVAEQREQPVGVAVGACPRTVVGEGVGDDAARSSRRRPRRRGRRRQASRPVRKRRVRNCIRFILWARSIDTGALFAAGRLFTFSRVGDQKVQCGIRNRRCFAAAAAARCAGWSYTAANGGTSPCRPSGSCADRTSVSPSDGPPGYGASRS